MDNQDFSPFKIQCLPPPLTVDQCEDKGLPIDQGEPSYFVGAVTLIVFEGLLCRSFDFLSQREGEREE